MNTSRIAIPLAFLSLFFAVPVAFAACVSPGGCAFVAECEALDPISNKPKKVFKAGNDMLLRFEIDAPDLVAEQRGELTVFVEAEIHGHDFLVEVDKGSIIIDSCEARRDLEIVGRLNGNECVGTVQNYETTITLPEDLPRIEGSIMVHLDVGAFGAAECSREVKIQP